MKNKKNQAGRSMVEMLSVIAIIGVLTTGAIWALSSAFIRFKSEKLTSQVNEIYTNVTNYYLNKKDYSDLTTKLAIEKELLPSEMKVSDTAAKHIFGASATISATASSKFFFSLTLNDIPESACYDLLSDIDHNIIQRIEGKAEATLPLDVEEFSVVCNGDVDIIIDFKPNFKF